MINDKDEGPSNVKDTASAADSLKIFWFVLLVFFVVWNFSFDIQEASFSPLEAVVLILIGLTVYKNSIRRLKETVALRYLLPFAAFMLPMIPSRFLIVDLHGPPAQTAWRIFRNFLELTPLIFLLVLANIREVRTLKVILVFLLILASLASVVGIIQSFSDGRYLTGTGVYGNFNYLGIFPPLSPKVYPLAFMTLGRNTVVTHVPDSDIFRAHGSLHSHNNFGAFLIPILCLTLGSAFMIRRQRTVFSLLALPQVLALILCLSRGVLAGAAIGLGILMIMVKNRARNLITILLLFLIAFSILTVFRPDILEAFTERVLELTNIKEAHGMEPREEAWKLSIEASSKRLLLGHGTGGLKDFTLSGVPLSSHNNILDILYARGIIALAGWIFLLILILKDSLTVFRAGSHPQLKAMGAGIVAGMLGLSVTGLTQTLVHSLDTAALIWLCFGLAAAARKMTTEHHDP